MVTQVFGPFEVSAVAFRPMTYMHHRPMRSQGPKQDEPHTPGASPALAAVARGLAVGWPARGQRRFSRLASIDSDTLPANWEASEIWQRAIHPSIHPSIHPCIHLYMTTFSTPRHPASYVPSSVARYCSAQVILRASILIRGQRDKTRNVKGDHALTIRVQ